jgi:endonuclease YncB( thermonuclease family)
MNTIAAITLVLLNSFSSYRISDGDTITLKYDDRANISVRLAEFDAPESSASFKSHWDSTQSGFSTNLIKEIGDVSKDVLRHCIDSHSLSFSYAMPTKKGYRTYVYLEPKLLKCILESGGAYTNDDFDGSDELIQSYINKAMADKVGIFGHNYPLSVILNHVAKDKRRRRLANK